jgi:hypothetical protein
MERDMIQIWTHGDANQADTNPDRITVRRAAHAMGILPGHAAP